jgi:MarR family transcriptional regulator for hemolysin
MERKFPDHLGRRLVFTGKALRAHFEATLAAEGASVPTWAALAHAHESPGMSQTELADLMGIEGPTLVRHLDRLCAEGLVTRRRDVNDRRVTRIDLTEAGDARYQTLAAVAQGFDRELRGLFAPEEVEILERMLIRIAAYAEDAHVYTNN